jgi:hypothetical protein
MIDREQREAIKAKATIGMLAMDYGLDGEVESWEIADAIADLLHLSDHPEKALESALSYYKAETEEIL